MKRFTRCLSPGRTPVPAALRSFGLLPRPHPTGIPILPAPAGLCLAALAAVPPGSGLHRGAAAEAGHRGLRVQLRDLPLQQTSGEVSAPAQDPDSQPDLTCCKRRGSKFALPLRCALGVMENTHCLFQALLKPAERETYSNPLYEHTELAIWPSVHPQSLQLWRGKESLCEQGGVSVGFRRRAVGSFARLERKKDEVKLSR